MTERKEVMMKGKFLAYYDRTKKSSRHQLLITAIHLLILVT